MAEESAPPGSQPQPGSQSPPAPPEKKKPNPRRRAIVLVVVGVIAVVAIVALARFIAYARVHETTDDAQVEADIVAVTSKISERVKFIAVDTNYRVRKGQLLVELDDQDERRRVDQSVAAYDAAVAQARAAQANVQYVADQQRAQIAQGDAGIRQAEAGSSGAGAQNAAAAAQEQVAAQEVLVAVAQQRAAAAEATSARANEVKAEADLSRAQALSATGDTSISQLDAARAAAASALAARKQADDNAAVAKFNVASARAKQASQRASTQSADFNVAMQNAQIATAQGKLAEDASVYKVPAQASSADATAAQAQTYAAQLRQARDTLSYTVIRSPIDGIVGEKDVSRGATVAPGATLLTLVPAHGLYITANYKETQIGKMRPGQSVDISVDGYPGRKFTGHVVNLGPASQATYSLVPAQNATGNFVKVTQRLPVRIVVDDGVDENHQLRVGMSVETSVRTSE